MPVWPSWASDQDILSKLIIDLRSKCALTGERRNAKLVYLALQSRRRRKPVSIKGQSASGKSYTVQCALLAVRPAAVMIRTGLSELALVYSKESFRHRTIVIFEAVALKESRKKNEGHQGAMILRTLMSEGVIRHETTIKNANGEFETVVFVQPPAAASSASTSSTAGGPPRRRLRASASACPASVTPAAPAGSCPLAALRVKLADGSAQADRR